MKGVIEPNWCDSHLMNNAEDSSSIHDNRNYPNLFAMPCVRESPFGILQSPITYVDAIGRL